MSKTIGILTGGGDVPGLNPAMKAFIAVALNSGYKVYGVRRGWAGLLEYDFNDPESHSLIFLIHRRFLQGFVFEQRLSQFIEERRRQIGRASCRERV